MSIAPLEPIEVINKRLVDYFGRFETGEANWKLIWSEDYLEKKLIKYTDAGVELINPEVREVRKASYIRHKYVLTQATPVPEINQKELCGLKVSYEPIWTFEDDFGNPTQPNWELIQVLITTIFSQIAKAGHNTPIQTPEELQNTTEGIEYRANKIYEALYGNESKITDAIHMDSGVGYGERKRNDWTH